MKRNFEIIRNRPWNLNDFYWTQYGLCFDDQVIIPIMERWLNDVQNLRVATLNRVDRPERIRVEGRRASQILNMKCILR